MVLFFGGKTVRAVDTSVEEQIRASLEANKNKQSAESAKPEDLIASGKDAPKAEAETIADVSIRNAEISEIKKNQLKLVFDVENKMELQADLVYGLELIKEQGENKVSMVGIKLFPEDKITIEKNKSIHREIIYQSPEYLSGDYILWLKIKDESGLTLALQSFRVNLVGSGEFIEQGNPCYLTIEGEKDQKYNLAQGVDLKKAEKLFLNCQTKNLTGETMTVFPFIEFYQRDFYGKKTGEYEASESEAITFNKDEEKLIKIAIPLPENPQAYDAKLVFKKEGKIVSNPVIAHFVLSGKSGTIINASLDKNQYTAGEKAQLTLLWAGSADFFFQSRTGGSFLVDPTFEVEFKDSKGVLCSAKSIHKTEESKTVLIIPLEKACNNPVVTIKLMDEGQTLYEKVITTESEKEPGKQSTSVERTKENDKLVWIISALLFGLVLALASSLYLRRKKVKNISKTFIFLLILGASFLMTEKTQALTKLLEGTAYYTPAPAGARLALTALTDCGFDFTGIPKCTSVVTTNCYINASLVMYGSERWGCYQDEVKFTYDLSSTSVNQGTKITATGSAIALNACSNGVTAAIAVNPKDDGNNANLRTVLPATWFTEDKEHHEDSYVFDTKDWSCGNYAARFYMAFVHGNGGGYFDDAIGYSVNNCCSNPTCSTGPGCRASLTNGVVAGGTCCGGSCYDCASGYYWTGSYCASNAPVPTALSANISQSTESTTPGTAFTITWGSTNATNCTVSKSVNGTLTNAVWASGTSGSQAASPTIIGTHVFTNTCTGAGGQASQSVTHAVSVDTPLPPPLPPSPVCAPTCDIWSGCSVACGTGTQSRTCTNADCSTITETQSCTMPSPGCLHDSSAICTGLCGKQSNLAGCVESCSADPKCPSDPWCGGTTDCGPCNSGTWKEVAP